MKCTLVYNIIYFSLKITYFCVKKVRSLLVNGVSILGLDDLNTVIVSGVSGGERSSCGGDNLLFLLLIG